MIMQSKDYLHLIYRLTLGPSRGSRVRESHVTRSVRVKVGGSHLQGCLETPAYVPTQGLWAICS